MGDLGSDHDSAISLIVDEYRRLQKHNPQHELLQYVTNVTDQGFKYINNKYEAFLDRFETPEDKKLNHIKVTKVLVSYFIDLKNAVDKIEGIDRSPKIEPIKPKEPRKYLTIEDKVKQPEDLPF